MLAAQPPVSGTDQEKPLSRPLEPDWALVYADLTRPPRPCYNGRATLF